METKNDPPATTPAQKAKRAEQDQRIQNDITQYAQDILSVRADAELAAGVKNLGFDDASLDAGDALQKASQDAYTARQKAIGVEDAALAALLDAEDVARKRFVHYRDVVRIAYRKDAAARTALGATGIVPKDRQKLVTLARAAYKTAGEKPYADDLGNRSYDKSGLVAAVATLDAVDASVSVLAATTRAAIDATAKRNDAYADLTDWGVPFRAAVRRARKK